MVQLSRALHVLAIATAVVVWFVYTTMGGDPWDARAYWTVAAFDPYPAGTSYLYSPAFAQAMAPLQLLPFEVFVALVRALELACLYLLVGPFLPLVVFLPPVATEINAANVNLIVVAIAVYGFRYPALWAFVLHTKISPAVGLLWFAVRREWRSLGIVIAVGAVTAGVSFLLAPGLWIEWPLFVLSNHPGTPPAVVRVPLAALLVVWGALTNRPWVMPVAVWLAMPRWYFLTPAALVGVLWYVRRSEARWPEPIRRFAIAP